MNLYILFAHTRPVHTLHTPYNFKRFKRKENGAYALSTPELNPNQIFAAY